MKENVLVYPCGTEIGLEIFRAAHLSTKFQLIGGSSSFDHGQFVYEKQINALPFITDDSGIEEIQLFDEAIRQYNISYIYPAMDGVLAVFSKYREYLTPIVIAPCRKTAEITRSKRMTYQSLEGIVPLPELYAPGSVDSFPVFVKPDKGQGSVGTSIIYNPEQLEEMVSGKKGKDLLVLEYLPGEEYTIDCFTNDKGELIYARGRKRKRIKNGISVSAIFEDRTIFRELAERINNVLRQKGGWFFQLKEDKNGHLKLLEVASRIAGTSSISRASGVNLPLLTLYTFGGQTIQSVIINPYAVELDRAFYNSYHMDISYKSVYVDYDDTLCLDGKVNIQLVSFLYQCLNEKKHIVLLSKHEGDLREELAKKRLISIFDEIIQIQKTEEKYWYVSREKPIFIDDSFGERMKIYDKLGIPVFDTHMVECLIREGGY